MGAAVKRHVSAPSYDRRGSVEHVATVDQAHPTDHLYRLLWLEIYAEIKRAGWTFGKLNPATDGPILTELAEPTGRLLPGSAVLARPD
jgi:hypothetical protein